MLLEYDDSLDTTRSTDLSIVQVIVFSFLVNRRVSPFSTHMNIRVLSEAYKAIESLTFHRKLVLTRLFALLPVAVSRLWGFGPSELKSPCSALCIEAPESITNIRSSVSLAPSQENKTLLSSALSLHIFSPNSALLCWYNLLVWAREDFAHEVHLFG